jgi:hypothetical protein
VYSTSAPETRAARTTNHYQGDTVIIQDKLAAAMYLDERRRQQRQRAEALM